MPHLLIAGLGNPGVKYQNTRHNIGFTILDSLSKECGFSFSFDKKFNAEVAEFKAKTHRIFFLKPQTFMNLSGESITPFIRYFDVDEMLVVHDELDVPFGDIRFKRGGSSGGHNGLKSIDKHYGSEYCRLRFGIGRDAHRDVADFVLSEFDSAQVEQLPELITHSYRAVMAFCENPDLQILQNQFTRRAKASKIEDR